MQLNIYFTIKKYFPYNSYHNTLLHQTVSYSCTHVQHTCIRFPLLLLIFVYSQHC